MRECNQCHESMDDGWTTECGSIYICSKECMQDRLVKVADMSEKRAKRVLSLYYKEDGDVEDMTDEEWDWVCGLFWTEWYDEDDEEE